MLYATIAVLFLLVSSLCGLYLFFVRGEGAVVEILSDGRTIRTLEPAKLAPDTPIYLHEGGGNNVLLAGPGGVRMVSSDCPGGDCLRMPEIHSAGGIIVCLPHRLIVRFRGPASHMLQGTSLDAVSY